MSDGRVVDLAEFKQLLETIAAERPEFVYNNPGKICFYGPTQMVDGSTSRCIIGEALNRLGFDETAFDVLETGIDNAHQILGRLGFGLAVCDYAVKVQRLQDGGMSWGDAVKEAIK